MELAGGRGGSIPREPHQPLRRSPWRLQRELDDLRVTDDDHLPFRPCQGGIEPGGVEQLARGQRDDDPLGLGALRAVAGQRVAEAEVDELVALELMLLAVEVCRQDVAVQAGNRTDASVEEATCVVVTPVQDRLADGKMLGLPPFGGPGSKLVHRRSRDDGGLSERR